MRRRWIWSQRWLDVAFMHWPVDEARLRALVPPRLTIDRHDGRVWVSGVAFRMARVRPRGLLPVPPLSWFPELNLRTYVVADDKPGVFFLSIRAGARAAAWLARRITGLPYRFAPMRWSATDDEIALSIAGADSFAAAWRAPTAPTPTAAGTLDHWLLERYALYCAQPDGRIERGDIEHAPWLAAATEIRLAPAPFADVPLSLSSAPALMHASSGVDVRGWRFREV